MNRLLTALVAALAAVFLTVSVGLAPVGPSVGFPSPLGTASADDDDDDNSGSGNSGSGGGNSGSGNSGSGGGNSGSGEGQGKSAPKETPGSERGGDDDDREEHRRQRRQSAGERMSAGSEDGTVMVRLPGADEPAKLDKDASIPVGSVVDARNGSVKLTAADGQWAVFKGAVFQLRQASEGKRPVTELVLRGGDFSSCGPTGSAAFAAKKGRRKSVRGMWARGKGNFRTRGRHGAATVRGTKWYTADTCDGTLVKVKRGKVAVRDFARKRTVLVRKGERYLAKPAQRPARKSVSS